jgi:hypothetical protein
MSLPRPALAELRIADPPERWRALGFRLEDSRADVGGVRLTLGGAGAGITGWAIRHLPPTEDIDGLLTSAATSAPASPAHPNGATGIDQVVITTPDFDRTAQALDRAGLTLRRIREAGGFRQGFRRLGPAILELVEATAMPPGPARFWGLVVIVPDLEALGERLGDQLSEPRAAVQPGRRIATLRARAGLGLKLAFMDPEP